MERWIDANIVRRTSRLAVAVLAVLLIGGSSARPAGADTFAPKGDD